jgi:hypothetical protein
MFTFFESSKTTFPKYYFSSSLPEPQSAEVLIAIKKSIREEFPNGPAISKTVTPDIDLSVKDKMKHISKEIIKLRKKR